MKLGRGLRFPPFQHSRMKGKIMATEKKVLARVLRDFWPTDKDEDRVTAGTQIEVTMEALIDGMEKNILERVKVGKAD